MDVKNNFRGILSLICMVVLTGLQAQEPSKNTSSNFPKAYFGVYKGNLEIHTVNGSNTLPMEFHLLPTTHKDEYQYTIVYINNGNRQERLYTLKTKDASKGLYVVDENNGILLDAKVLGNKLFSMFEVQGSLLTTQLTFEDDHMIFEITFSRKETANKSGTTDDSAIEVLSYPITTIQKGILKKN